MTPTFTLLAAMALMARWCQALPTWPSIYVDEIEDLMFLNSGFNARQFANGVTPCSSSPDGTSRSAAAEWLRTAFHDMGNANALNPPTVGGIDASLMFETTRSENIGAAFPSTLNTYSAFFNTRATMADLIALGVYTATRSCTGPIVPMRAGRKDAQAAGDTGVPEPVNPTFSLFAQFARMGFNTADTITMTACGHTVGGVHSVDFPQITTSSYALCDSTGFVFDGKIAQEFISGHSIDPMTVGPAALNGFNSDGRVFGFDGNVTITALADPTTFATQCASIFQRMIEVVPGGTVLSDIIQPYEVKPANLQLTLLSGGTTLQFAGQIRVRTTVRPQSAIASVQLIYKNRSGGAGGTIATVVAGTSAGFDDTFTFYSFSTTLDSTTSISSFTVLITGTDASKTTYDNNGVGYPIQDNIFYLNPQSCIAPVPDGNNNRPVTIVAAVRSSIPAPTVTMDVILRLKRTDIPTTINVPKLQDAASAMTFQYCLGPYSIYSATYPLAYAQSFNAEFGVTVTSASVTASDTFKHTFDLPAFCGASLSGSGTCGSASSSSSSTTASLTTTTSSTTSTTSSPSPSVSGWSAVGCYTDSVQARSLPFGGQVAGGPAAMTNELCIAACQAAGYTLAGTEYAQECYCGNAIQNGGAPATDGCTMTCTGNGAEICGGSNRLTLWSHGPLPSGSTTSSTTTSGTTTTTTSSAPTGTASGWTALGCYNDTVAARGLSVGMDVPGGAAAMTIELCQAACHTAGYILSGVEYGGECYCDNTFKNGCGPASDGSALCTMTCNGNGAEICGGPNRLNVFKYGAASTTTTAAPTTTSSAPTGTASAWTTLGCYNDTVTARGLSVGMAVPGGPLAMTVELCQAACHAAGYVLSGVEYAQECYCDNVFRNGCGPASDGAAQCNMACKGNAAETCGGPNRLSVSSYGAVAPPPASWSSLGCYTDNVNARSLLVRTGVTGGMTVEKCQAACKSAGYTLAGVEYSVECYCDNAIHNGGAPASSGCNMPCAGDTTETCGGSSLLNIYSSGSAPAIKQTVGAYTYNGCYLDSTTARILTPGAVGSLTMTLEACATFCNGYTYFGTEYGDECYCGNTLTATKEPDSDCSMPCVGDATEFCGAGYRLSVYKK